MSYATRPPDRFPNSTATNRCYTGCVRRLIINADDFGLTVGVNRAIAEAHQRGIVSSATIMANSRAFSDAVDQARYLLRRSTNFGVGCHVVLLDGESLLGRDEVHSLLQPGTENGDQQLRTSLSDFAMAALRGKLNADEIQAEAMAQMQRIQSAGIPLSHFDTHKHAHMFSAVLQPLLRAARALEVPAVRNPFGRLFPLPLVELLRQGRLWTRFAQMSVLRSFAARFRAQVSSHGLRTTDGTLGVFVTGVLDLDLFVTIVDSVPQGTWEFVCHPGYNDSDLDQVRTRLRQSRAQELEVLTSSEAKQALERRDIQLISYRQL